ncbi:MAG TPA: M20/M25/M40 family metallo-hydrolase [Longimicrobiales bacterium]|nr:M20/M25/M40 family metallo-hydrolase [Longimicrobiales bacterium]
MIDRDRLLTDLRALVRTPSINPSVDPDGEGESEAAAYVAGAMEGLGLDVARLETEPGRTSVVATLRGTGGGRSLMLNGHLDTVGVRGMPDPFSADLRDGRLYGRGAYDMKGAVAACMAAMRALSAGERPAGDVILTAVADEEHASAGTAQVLKHHRTDGCIVTEPTQLELCIAHKGFVWVRVETRGRAAHGSRHREGIDANVRMGRVLRELEHLCERVVSGPTHPLLGPPSLHAATLRGGTGISTYAARCVLEIERRTLPGETPEQVMAEMDELLERLRAEDPDLEVGAELLLAREPFQVAEDAPLPRLVAREAARATGAPVRVRGETYWMDAALTAAAGIETVVIGPRGEGAHAAEEWVDVESLVTLADILAGSARAYGSEPAGT